MMTDINVKTLLGLLSGCSIGKEIFFFQELGSTNLKAADLARCGAQEGTLIIADTQTAGKGRLGRAWYSPPTSNLYASFILRPDVELAVASRITLAAGLAVAETMRSYCGEEVSLKWPNDVLIHGLKACGILTEMKYVSTRVEFIIVGIGVNINMHRADFDEDLRDRATSLLEETGSPIDRMEFIVRLCHRFQHWYGVYLTGDFAAIRDRWIILSGMIGKQVLVTYGNQIEKGKVIGMDEKGSLLILNQSDVVKEIMAGDV